LYTVGNQIKLVVVLLQINDNELRMLAALHSLLVYQSLHGIYSDECHWSVADLGFAIDQLHEFHAIGCDLQSVDDATQILTHVYTAKCRDKRDAEKIRAFIFRLLSTRAAGSDVRDASTLLSHFTIIICFPNMFTYLVVFCGFIVF